MTTAPQTAIFSTSPSPWSPGSVGFFRLVILAGLSLLWGCVSDSAAEAPAKIAPGTALEAIPARLSQDRPAHDPLALSDAAIPDSINQLLLPPIRTVRKPLEDQGRVTKAGKTGTRESSEPLLDIVVDETPARAFFLGLAEESKMNLIVHPQVRGMVTLTMRNASVSQVVQTVCRMYDFNCEPSPTGYFIGPARLLTRQYHVNYLRVQRKGVTRTQISSGRTKTATSTTENNNSGDQTNSQSFQTSGSEVVTDQNASFWEEFTYSLCGVLGLGFTLPESSGTAAPIASTVPAGVAMPTATQLPMAQPVMALPQPPPVAGSISQSLLTWNPQNTERVVIGCAEQDEQGNTQSGRRVVISPQTGSVMVRAYPSELREVEYFLEQQKQDLERQVILEAKILEVELSDGFQSGINWSMILAHHRDQVNQMAVGGGGTMMGDSGNNPMFSPNTALNLTPADLPNSQNILFGGAFATRMNLSDFSALIELLDAQGQVHVLSSPRIATLNNQKAVIRVGQDEQFVTDVRSETSGTSVVLVPEFTTFFSGIALDVTPQISQDYGIMLHIHPTVSQVTTDEKQITLGSATQTYPMALNRVRESDSMVHAANGEVVVIGGLMKDFSNKRNAGVPFLKNLPVVGNLFTNQEKVEKKTELVILMRPVIVEAGNRAWEEDMDRLERRLPPEMPGLLRGIAQ
ncbi:MAG: pilus (MSHA type) biogenesis protein MshL [Nitrospirae bacterium]|nr:pilus (MSHA type) biogenesis protein MshL [Magnetococcales bacterium]HAT49620.1 pilus (MSHA type) biogenesis protein MshL [Alphaproteobacteria bacterium]